MNITFLLHRVHVDLDRHKRSRFRLLTLSDSRNLPAQRQSSEHAGLLQHTVTNRTAEKQHRNMATTPNHKDIVLSPNNNTAPFHNQQISEYNDRVLQLALCITQYLL